MQTTHYGNEICKVVKTKDKIS